MESVTSLWDREDSKSVTGLLHAMRLLESQMRWDTSSTAGLI